MKPIEAGCLAIITHPDDYGWPVDILYRAPIGEHKYPDGITAFSLGGCWVIKSLGGDFRDIARAPNQQSAIYASCPSSFLMRIDGDEEQFKAEQNERVADKLLEVM